MLLVVWLLMLNVLRVVLLVICWLLGGCLLVWCIYTGLFNSVAWFSLLFGYLYGLLLVVC